MYGVTAIDVARVDKIHRAGLTVEQFFACGFVVEDLDRLTLDEIRWRLLDYDNGEDGCPHCGRHRLCKCPNGRHRCEKCNWSPELNDYVPVD